MSIHPSLKIDSAGSQQRNVLTRIERIKDLMKKGLWQEKGIVTGLPKTKVQRIKTHKEAKKEEAGTAAPGSAPIATQTAAKPAAGAAKPAAVKLEAKPAAKAKA